MKFAKLFRTPTFAEHFQWLLLFFREISKFLRTLSFMSRCLWNYVSMLVCSTNVLVANVLFSFKRRQQLWRNLFLIYKLEHIFMFSNIASKILEFKPLYNNKKLCVKVLFDLFLCHLIIDYFLFRRCSTKGAVLRKELHTSPFVHILTKEWCRQINKCSLLVRPPLPSCLGTYFMDGPLVEYCQVKFPLKWPNQLKSIL